MIHFHRLTLKDKLAFLHMFRDEASSGPENAAKYLLAMEIVVSEYELRLIFRDLQWSEKYVDELARLAPDNLTL